MRTIRTRMTLMIVFVILVSTGLLWMISNDRTTKTMTSQLEDGYSVTAEKTAHELTEWIATNAAIVDTLAADIGITGICDSGYDAFHGYLAEMLARLNRKGYIYDFYFTYPDNTMACATDFLADGTVDYVNGREWYREAVRTGELFYSTPYLDSDSGLPIITISRAVTADGKVKGVIAADIFVDVLVDIVRNADAGKDSYAFLVDQNMGMIVHPNREYDFDDEPHGVMDVRDVPAGYGTVLDNIRSGSKETVYLEDYDGVTRGVVVSRIENTGWYFGIATSREELMRGVSRLVRGFLIAAILAVATGAVLAFFLAREVDRLNRQHQATQAHVLELEKQAADEASEAKSRFLADMSHEIRTPINTVLGMNEMILRESIHARNISGNSEEREAFRNITLYAGNIRSAGSNLLSIINDILDLSKVEKGKMEIADAAYTLSSLLNDVCSMAAFRAQEKNLQFIVDVDEALPDGLCGDKVRVRQVITNILNNALKYTHQGSISLTVRGEADSAEVQNPQLRLTVTIRDTGIGIRPEDMDKLFNPFQRVDLRQNSTVEGTGLGLAISRDLTEMMGGTIRVESEYGKGSVFTIDLPQKILSREPVGDFRARYAEDILAAGEYCETFHAPDARILIVDDTKINLMVAEGFLKSTQLQIDTASGGRQAVEMALACPYDLILMDQRMPEISGTEAVRRIREAENSPNRKTPVICMTADAIIGARERYISEGFDDYLPKPVNAQDLEKKIAAYLPKDKVVPVSEETEKPSGRKNAADETAAAQPDSRNDVLRTGGIRPESGMLFCQQKEDLYCSLLQEFEAASRENTKALNRYFEEKDWKNYVILVHAVKSSSRTIGADELADRAAALEQAARENREKEIAAGNGLMLADYGAAAEAIRKAFGLFPDADDEEDVLEFSPEEE